MQKTINKVIVSKEKKMQGIVHPLHHSSQKTIASTLFHLSSFQLHWNHQK